MKMMIKIIIGILLVSSVVSATSSSNIRKDFYYRFETLNRSVKETDQYAHLLVLMEVEEEDRKAMLEKLMEAENIINKVRTELIDKYNNLPIKTQRMIKMQRKKKD